MCGSDRWRPQGATPRGLCRGTPGRSGTPGRRTGLFQSPPSDLRSSGTGTWIGSVHTCTIVCFRTDAVVRKRSIIYFMVG